MSYGGSCDNSEASFNSRVGAGSACGGVGMVSAGDGLIAVVWTKEHVDSGTDMPTPLGHLYSEEVHWAVEPSPLYTDA